MPTKSQASRQRAAFKKQITKLRDLGLTGTRKIDLRKAPSKSEINLIRKYGDVLGGKAAVIKIPKSEKKSFKGIFPIVGDTIIVPKKKGERVKYDPKVGEITGSYRKGKKTYKEILFRDLDKIKPPKGDRQRFYTVPFKRGKGRKAKYDYQTFDSLTEMKNFMAEYGKSGRYKDWGRFIKIIDAEDINDLYDHLKNPDEVFFDGENIDEL